MPTKIDSGTKRRLLVYRNEIKILQNRNDTSSFLLLKSSSTFRRKNIAVAKMQFMIAVFTIVVTIDEFITVT